MQQSEFDTKILDFLQADEKDIDGPEKVLARLKELKIHPNEFSSNLNTSKKLTERQKKTMLAV